MKISCHPFIASLAVAGVIAAATVGAQERGYPQRPVEIVVPYAAGGGADVMARAFSAATVMDNSNGNGSSQGAHFDKMITSKQPVDPLVASGCYGGGRSQISKTGIAAQQSSSLAFCAPQNA